MNRPFTLLFVSKRATHGDPDPMCHCGHAQHEHSAKSGICIIAGCTCYAFDNKAHVEGHMKTFFAVMAVVITVGCSSPPQFVDPPAPAERLPANPSANIPKPTCRMEGSLNFCSAGSWVCEKCTCPEQWCTLLDMKTNLLYTGQCGEDLLCEYNCPEELCKAWEVAAP